MTSAPARRNASLLNLPLLAGLASLAGLALLAGGCLAPADGVIDRGGLARLLREKGLAGAQVVIPYELTDEMRTWVHKVVPHAEVPRDKRLQLLLDALLDPDKGLGITYEGHYTGTAAEVFATRRANCLSFTNIFVGLAREIGVEAFYLDVDDIQRFEREGDLVVVSGHVSAGFAVDRETQVLDFTLAPVAHYREIRRISDRTAVALYYSNRGGELLRGGQYVEALPWLRSSVVLDPDLARGWVNLGVALRRTGDPTAAEAAYRKALEIDPDSSSAYQNLSSILRLRGQQKEADEMLALAARVGVRNPFSYLDLGDLSLAHGRLDEAHRYYKKALHLYREHAEPYAAMGQWAAAAGDLREARRWLEKAAAIDRENGRVKKLAAALQSADRGGSHGVG
jgi:Flp pilus assembly protein TadD